MLPVTYPVEIIRGIISVAQKQKYHVIIPALITRMMNRRPLSQHYNLEELMEIVLIMPILLTVSF